MPKLGDADTPYEEVADFYRFWQNLRSWRTFDLHTEHNLAEAEDREERRWMQRQNKNITDRIKRDEYKRVQAFVQLAYENDPRVIAHRESVAAAKLAAKAAKEEALAQERAAREAAAHAAAEAERQKQAVAEVAKAAREDSNPNPNPNPDPDPNPNPNPDPDPDPDPKPNPEPDQAAQSEAKATEKREKERQRSLLKKARYA